MNWFSNMKDDRAVRSTIINHIQQAKWISSQMDGKPDYDMELLKP